MTVKRRFFYSNIRMVFVTIGGIVLALLTNRIMTIVMFRSRGFIEFSDIESYGRFTWSIALVSLAVFVVFFLIINSILANRMTKKITLPLDILTMGVKRIQDNDFSYRIDYDGDDEFRLVCNAFNLMAEQLEASNRVRLKDEANRRELLAGISHDLRTPLTTISGYLDGIESGVASTPQMRERYLNTIKFNAEGMKHIIEQLFLFSKLDMDEFLFTPQRFDIMRAISDMIEEFADAYALRGLDINIREGPKDVFIYADVSHLRRVIINILENSVKYKVKERARMTINVQLDPSSFADNSSNFVRLTFADDGPGVAQEILPDLFNVFYRADSSRHSAGSGLGLAISAKIIERSGGTIHAELVDSGGLAVIIYLPLDTEIPK